MSIVPPNPPIAEDAENGVTDYGFKWGPVEVTRLAIVRGQRVMQVATDHRQIEIFVSPTGRNVRVYIDGAEVSAPCG